MSSAADGGRSWRRFRVLLTGLVLCRGLVYLCVMPPFEGWDEFEHVGYIVHVLETGRPAILGETNVPRSLLGPLIAFPQPKSVVELQLGRLGAVDYATYWKQSTSPRLRRGEMELYQAQHSWWYYRLVAPVFEALGGVRDLRRSVGGLRLLNIGLISAAVWTALGVVGRLVRRTRDAGLIGLAVAAHPLFLIDAARVSSDAAGVLLATVAVAGCLSLRRDRELTRWLGIGVATGLAVLAKAVNLGLLPFVAWCWLATAVRAGVAPSRAFATALVLSLGFLGVTQGEFRANLARYGGLTPMQEAVVNRSRGRTIADLARTARKFRWERQVRRLWLHDSFFFGGWSNQRPAPGLVHVYALAIVAGMAGYTGVRWSRRAGNEPVFVTSGTPISCAVLCLSITAALGYHMVQSRLAWGRSTTGAWYAASAFPWFVVLVAGGGLSWPWRRLGAAVPVVLAVACLAADATALGGRMLHTYSGGATGWEALRRLAALQPAILGTPTLFAALAAEATILAWLLAVFLRGLPDDGRPVVALIPHFTVRTPSPRTAATGLARSES